MEQRPHTLEETIRPVRREARSGEARPSAAPTPRSFAAWWPAATGILLVALLLAVFFVLPRLAEPDDEPAAVAAAPAAAPPVPEDTGPVLSPEERAELDARAQRDLAALVTQEDRLEERAVSAWGGELWARYQALTRSGDDAYLQDDVATAAEAYGQALDTGAALLEEGFRLMSEALATGDAALAAGDAPVALERFRFALSISPNDDRARSGLRRAEQLPRVLTLMQDAATAEAAGDLPAAIELYREAVALDPAWVPAKQALAAASGNLEQYRFERFLSQGYTALGESEFDDAIEHFTAALSIRPASKEATDGLFQAEEGLKLGQLELARVRALAFEARELWSQAIEQYESALATDPTLEYAISGLERARARRDLEVKILNLIDNPRLLLDDGVLKDAERLRAQAAAVDPKGAQITNQLARLDRLFALATTPQSVMLRSDALTQVTVYRVGTIGSFTETEIALRPGEYTVIGSRNGYRDVRRSFTVLPGQRLDPIEIVCVEPI